MSQPVHLSPTAWLELGTVYIYITNIDEILIKKQIDVRYKNKT